MEETELLQQISELEAIVEGYAGHTPDCEVLNFEPNDETDTTIPKCTCGYKDAMYEYYHKYLVEEAEYGYDTQKNFD